MKRTVPIGLLFSTDGVYGRIGAACRTGALEAVARVNADPARRIAFAVVERDPGGVLDNYAPLCAELLRSDGLRHIVGCVTSSSRKEVIPTLDRHGGTLWYTAPYEGFEASDRVVYLHACPNQHLLPLLDWAFVTQGRRGYLTGSNYIWGWEMNRLARQTITAAEGQIAGERYLPLGSVDVGQMIDEIRQTAPDFILNSLIGPSSHAFLSAYADLGASDPRFAPDRCPVLSCNLTECELPDLGHAAEGLIAAGPYFDTGVEAFASSFAAAADLAIRTLADLLDAPGQEGKDMTALLDTDAGRASGIDPQTHHVPQRALIARVRDGAFAVIRDFGLRRGDPYLSAGWTGPASAGASPLLRVVS
ncbi:MAG: transporter substrate-binding protein [Alphaproteobacteria bacterium]|nr:transporter substrate-binding protein [Alphaproteobacteria bacterium]